MVEADFCLVCLKRYELSLCKREGEEWVGVWERPLHQHTLQKKCYPCVRSGLPGGCKGCHGW